MESASGLCAGQCQYALCCRRFAQYVFQGGEYEGDLSRCGKRARDLLCGALHGAVSRYVYHVQPDAAVCGSVQGKDAS